MSGLQLYLILGAAVFLLGLHGLLMTTDSIRRLIAVNLMGAGIFLIMVALAGRISPPDPVLHALVVTGLVVAISATAFALRLITAAARVDSGQSAVPDKASRLASKSESDVAEDSRP
ncbi:MAG: NADH-quinone oxidoreductase subunit K [Pseudohongiella sp.]|nr:NADH-quinone oxidoreductase subunit K [Pseudohongiella sp.]